MIRRLGPALVAVVALGALAARHPGLRFVDLVAFSARAEHLADRLVDPLYPVGYPALLALAHALGGDVLLVGKSLSVLAGAGAVLAATVLTGPLSALWLLGQGGLLQWGATEGTDLPAAALSLGALTAASTRRPWLADLLCGAACLLRYTAFAVVPVVLLADRRALVPFLLALVPAGAAAAWSGVSPLPDQQLNLLIGAGRPTRLLSTDTLLRWPGGLGRALLHALPDWPVRVAAVGLLVGAWRRDRRAIALLAWGLLHCAMVAVAFSNPRLCLPAQLAFALGAPFLVPHRHALLGVAAVAVAARNVPPLATSTPQERELHALSAACAPLPGPFLANSPWFHTRHDGWLRGGIQLSGLGNARGLTPEELARWMARTGARHVALDIARVTGPLPGLGPMMKAAPPGFSEAARTAQWRVYAASP